MPQSNGNGAVQTPAIDLATCSKAAFDDAVTALTTERRDRTAAGSLPQNPFTSGDTWYDVTPPMSHDALLLSAGNREFSLAAVKSYAEDMGAGEWMPTGQTIAMTGNEVDDGHHRLLAGYLGGHTFRSFVITSTPAVPNRFALYDQGKKRTIADSLHIAGWNGFGKVMATAIQDLAMRYYAGKLGVTKQPRFKKPNPRQALLFMTQNADFQASARHVMTNYADASAVIQSKAAAAFFGHLVIQHYGKAVLDAFFRPLALGANLADDSVILGLRNRLLLPEAPGQTMPARARLALLIKAFNMNQAGETMPRYRNRVLPMELPDPGQPFPRIEPPAASQSTATP